MKFTEMPKFCVSYGDWTYDIKTIYGENGNVNPAIPVFIYFIIR
jgi:hypothetical protein